MVTNTQTGTNTRYGNSNPDPILGFIDFSAGEGPGGRFNYRFPEKNQTWFHSPRRESISRNGILSTETVAKTVARGYPFSGQDHHGHRYVTRSETTRDVEYSSYQITLWEPVHVKGTSLLDFGLSRLSCRWFPPPDHDVCNHCLALRMAMNTITWAGHNSSQSNSI